MHWHSTKVSARRSHSGTQPFPNWAHTTDDSHMHQTLQFLDSSRPSRPRVQQTSSRALITSSICSSRRLALQAFWGLHVLNGSLVLHECGKPHVQPQPQPSRSRPFSLATIPCHAHDERPRLSSARLQPASVTPRVNCACRRVFLD
jgi:hypothetical protein